MDYISKNGNENDARRSLDDENPVNILDILKPAKPAEVPTYQDGEVRYKSQDRDINQKLILINLAAI